MGGALRSPGTHPRGDEAARDALVMEGTHFSESRPRGVTEFELEDEILARMRTAPANQPGVSRSAEKAVSKSG